MTINIIIGTFIIFLAPGNQIRFQTEMQNNFPDFFSLNLFNRVSISLYWILNKLFNSCSLSLALIYSILGVKTFFNKNFRPKIFSIISITLAILLIIKNIFTFQFVILPITSDNYFSLNILFKYFFGFISLLLIPFILCRFSKIKNNLFFYFPTLLIILATMFIITLSPTMDVSGNRVLFLPMILLNMVSISLIF
jgi:hypothetical protein